MPGPKKFEPSESDRGLASLIRAGRKSKGLTIEELAKRVGISTRSMHRIEALQKPVSLRELDKIESAIGSVRNKVGAAIGHLSLIDGESDMPASIAGGLSPDFSTRLSIEERHLLAAFRSLPEHLRLMALIGLQAEAIGFSERNTKQNKD